MRRMMWRMIRGCERTGTRLVARNVMTGQRKRSAMRECRIQSGDGGRARKFFPRCHEKPISYRDAISGWQDDERFRSFFINLLAQSPFSGYRWETPPIDSTIVDREFEFVLIDTPGFDE